MILTGTVLGWLKNNYFVEIGYFRIPNEISYKGRSNLVIHKLEIICLESNKAKKLVPNELVQQQKIDSCMRILNMQPYKTASFFIHLFH